MPHDLDPDTFGFVIGDLSRLMRAEMERRIAQAGLSVTPGEGRTLANIARIGCVRQNMLAERMGLEAMTLSTYLDRLEARGLVSRAPDPADRRAKLVNLTPAADEVLGHVKRVSEQLRADLSRGMPRAGWSDLLDELKRIRADLAAMRSQAGDKTARPA
ncbi:MarR family transcriptional regulator [Nitratireductor sp. CAU 1489]|uniref:MarR family transcriptional regulator n=1 Tax=Nitratireductor arenosus TaxID=2682096 RepID=A0A844QD76_9HYPH|nr:MarR family transcriptional regulator [Nitratireductor arenosus]MVA96584.1 MarR family transcriptional regulator [Nitratireductor arenosus]